jgi:hypothetical protein
MSDRQPLDEDLMRLFEGARTELPPAGFVDTLVRHLARARRVRLGTQVVLLALLAVAAALMTPYVARGSLSVMESAAQWLPDVGLALSSPAGWIGSLILGAWVLKRAHVFER